MPDLFGIDIAGLVADSIEDAGGVLDGKLFKVSRGTRTAGDLAGGTNPTSKPYPFKGFYDDRQLGKVNVRFGTQRGGESTLVRKGDRVVVILGATLPSGVVPAPSDRVLLEGETTTVDRVIERDPAGATYVLHVRKS